MTRIEMRILVDGREVSFEDLVEAATSRVSAHIQNEVKETVEAVLRERQSKDTGAEPRAVGIKDAVRILSISRSTIWRHIRDGQLETVNLGGRVLIRMESINRALKDGINVPREAGHE